MKLGYYTTGAALSILFLFPLLWGGYESFRGQPGSGQESGFGFGNYTRMADYGEGIATYLFNTAAVSADDGGRHAGRVRARRLRVRALPLPRQGAACSWPRSRSSWSRTRRS